MRFSTWILIFCAISFSQRSAAGLENCSKLFSAIAKNEATVVEQIVNQNKDTRFCVDAKGDTPLHHFVRQPHAEGLILYHLLPKASKAIVIKILEATNDDGLTPLMMAVERKNHYKVVLLLSVNDRGDAIAVDATNYDGNSALHHAVVFGDDISVDLLLMYGANPNLINNFGTTPLFSATAMNNVKVVKRLIQAGANLDDVKKSSIVLATAQKFRFHEVSEALLQAIPFASTIKSEDELEKKAQCKALLRAVSQGSFMKVDEHLKGVRECRDAKNNGALHYFARHNATVHVITLLKFRGGISFSRQNLFGNTAFMEAVRARNMAAMTAIVGLSDRYNSFEANAKNIFGETALHLAARTGDPAIFDFVKNQVTDRDAENHMGLTAEALRLWLLRR